MREMKTRTKVVTATASVALLALAGGTFALWSDTLVGNDILANTGHLDVTMTDATMWDASPKCQPEIVGGAFVWRGDTGHSSGATDPCSVDPQPVDGQALDDWYLVPQDVILVAAPIQVNLKGQNMAAKLEVNFGTNDLVDPDNSPGTGDEYYVTDGAGSAFTPDIDGDGDDEITITGVQLVEADSAAAALAAYATPGTGDVEYLFTPANDSDTNNDGEITDADGNSGVWAVFTVAFDDEDDTGRDYGIFAADDPAEDDLDAMDIQAEQIVTAINARLVQVRS